jgi:arylsulfatase A-like enzyme
MLARTLLVLALVPGLATASPRWGSGEPRRPNVVLLVADDMDYEHLGLAGHPLDPTPTIDALAATGVTFSHGFVPMSRCRPAQAAVLSGLHPHQNGVYFNVGADHIDPATSLAQHLKDAGYACLAEGKFWEWEPRAMGFENLTVRNYETFVRWDQVHLFDWLDGHAREKPFFVWWAPELPHVPHDPPARLRERFPLERIAVPDWFEGDAAAFREAEQTLLAMDAWLDEGVAQLVAKLTELGVHDDTLYVFWIDNGWANGVASKGWAFDKSLRTPVIFSWKNGLEGPRTFGDLVPIVDLYATILDYAGAEIPADCAGVSLRPRIEGRPYTPHQALYGALYPYISSQPDADAARDAYALWARTERWKLVLTLRDIDADSGLDGEREDVKVLLAPRFVRRRGDVELYDLDADPYERTNLAGSPEHAQLVQRLKQEALDWWRATGGGDLNVP